MHQLPYLGSFLEHRTPMLTEKETKKISKLLSFVLRHQPEAIGITLDENGWTAVDMLIEKVNSTGIAITPAILKHVVDTNAKKRFAFNDNFTKIRASQGHSVIIDLGKEAQQPPDVLYHGTAIQNLPSIQLKGLEKQSRNHVHLSNDTATAQAVGSRHGKPVVLTVNSGQMYNDGFTFTLSDNGVWLTDNVPAKYINN